MRLGEPHPRWERFDPRSVVWFLRVYGLALVIDVVTEIASGVWAVHAGHLYPWRSIAPLYPTWVLAIEWTLRAGGGLALALAATRGTVVRHASRVLAIVLLVALLERYSNHGVLLFLVAFYLQITRIETLAPDFEHTPQHGLGLVRAQLVLVYVFSALNKITHGFLSGHSLVNLLHGKLAAGPATALSWLVVAGELAIPLLLVRSPRFGVAAALVMHAAFTALVPNVASFGLTMIAMALLFSRVPGAPSPWPSGHGDSGARAAPPRT